MAQGQKAGFATSIAQFIGRPMAPTAMEIRSHLSPEDFARALRSVPAIIERGDSPYLHARRVRMATVKTSGQHVEVRFGSGPMWTLRKGYEGGSPIEAHLTGRIVPAQDGAVLSVDLITLSGLARGLVRLTPIVTALGAIATLLAVVLAPALAVIPLVVLSGGVSVVAVSCLVLRWSWRQKADEIARLLLVTNEATGSTTADVSEEPRHGLVRLLEPWLRDIPGSMIIDEMHRIGSPSGHA